LFSFLDPRLMQRARAVRVALIGDVALGLVAALLVLGQSVVLAQIAARSFTGAGLAAVMGLLTLFVAIAIGRAAAQWGFEFIGRSAAASIISTLRLEMIAGRLRGGGAATLDEQASASIATDAVEGIGALEATFARYLPATILAVVVPVAVLVVVAFVDPLSAVIMLLTLPLLPVFMWLIGRRTAQHTEARWQALSLLANHFLDVVRGLPTLRAFNRGEAQATTIEEVSEDYRRATMGTLKLAFLSGAVLEFAATIGIALVAVTVGVRLVEGAIGYESALIVLLLAPELYLPLRSLAAQFHASADGTAVAGRLLDQIDLSGDVPPGEATPPSPREASLRFEDISFSYPLRSEPVLRGVDLTLSPGEMVVLMGPSGSGKSTIASLLLRLVDPSQGRITAGTLDLAECDASSWRRMVAWVPQRPTLFHGTISENIWLSDDPCDESSIHAAAVDACADEFIRGLPDGYDTMVGEGGRSLSAGQVQRVALARAFLRDAPLWVFDEPTANLDPDTASAIAATIQRLRSGRSVLVIAHRPELAAQADRVLHLDAGRIADGAAAAGAGS